MAHMLAKIARHAASSAAFSLIILVAPDPAAIAHDDSDMYATIRPMMERQSHVRLVPTTPGFAPTRQRTATRTVSPARAARPPADGSGQRGWLEAILSDDTLRRGDVVIFPGGPKVFARSSGEPPWAEDDFEDIGETRTLSSSTRMALMALVGRVEPAAEPTARPLRVTIAKGTATR
jgi:hypothetical protein